MFASGGFGAKCTTRRAMAKTYRRYVPEQDLLLPPSLRDWLPEGHLAFFVSDLVEQLDLSAILRVYEDDERGYRSMCVTAIAPTAGVPMDCTSPPPMSMRPVLQAIEEHALTPEAIEQVIALSHRDDVVD